MCTTVLSQICIASLNFVFWLIFGAGCHPHLDPCHGGYSWYLRDLCQGCGKWLGRALMPIHIFLHNTWWLHSGASQSSTSSLSQQLYFCSEYILSQSQSLPFSVIKRFARNSISSTYMHNSVLCKDNTKKLLRCASDGDMTFGWECARTYDKPYKISLDIKDGVIEVLCLLNTNQKNGTDGDIHLRLHASLISMSAVSPL